MTGASREPSTAREIIMAHDRPQMRHCDRCRKGQVVFERFVGWVNVWYKERQLVCGVCGWTVERQGGYR